MFAHETDTLTAQENEEQRGAMAGLVLGILAAVYGITMIAIGWTLCAWFGATSAHAASFDIAIGGSKLDSTNGIFYYNDTPNARRDINTRSPSFSLGVAETFRGQEFALTYWYVGRVSNHTETYSGCDGNYHAGQDCGSKQEWSGRGTTQALALQWVPHMKVGGFDFFVGIGPTLVRSRYQAYGITGTLGYTADCPDCRDRVKWLMYSAGVRYGNLTVTYRGGKFSSSAEYTFSTKANTLLLGWRF